MSKVWAIAASNLQRFLRDRSNIFFVFVFPLGLVFILGLSFGGGGTAQLGLVAGDDPLAARLVQALEEGRSLEVVRVADAGVLRDRVERGVYMAGLIIPGNLSEQLAAGRADSVGSESPDSGVPDARSTGSGSTGPGSAGPGSTGPGDAASGSDGMGSVGGVQLEFLSPAGGAGMQLQLPVMAAVGKVSERVRAAGFVSQRADVDFDAALAQVDELAEETPAVTVSREWLGESPFGEEVETFDLGAASQLVLFMFLTGLAASGALIQSRQLGVSRRMLATPTSVLTIVTGEALGRFAVALFQGAYIMVATWLLFGVEWGDPAGALALLTVFAGVAAGAGMLMGATFENDQQAGAIAVIVGLGLAALGGAMVPLELFGPTMQSIANLTPHAWAVDGFGVLVRHGGTIIDVLPQLAVLTGFAAALLALATWRLRRALTRGGG